MGNNQQNEDGLDRELDRARDEGSELPQSFTAAVMQQITSAAKGFSILTRLSRRVAASRYRHTSLSEGGDTVTKKVLIGMAAAAMIILGIAYWTGYPPVSREGTEATVGAAQRYQAKQMSDKDVVLGDAAAQKFLQSEGFDRLMKNEKARAFLKKASKDPQLISALTSPQFVALVRDHSVAELLAKDNLTALLQHPDLLVALRRDDFADAMHSDAFLALLTKRDIQAALVARDFESAMKAPGIAQQFTDANLRPQYAALVSALNSGLAASLARVDLISALRDQAMVSALSNVQLRNLLTDASLVSWLRQGHAAELLADGLFVDALRQVDFVNALRADGFNAALTSSGFEAALNAR